MARLSVKYNRAYREYKNRYGEPYHSPLKADECNRVSLQRARRCCESLDRARQLIRRAIIELRDQALPRRASDADCAHTLPKLLIGCVKDFFLECLRHGRGQDLTRIRRNYVFKGVNFCIYHGFETLEGSLLRLQTCL